MKIWQHLKKEIFQMAQLNVDHISEKDKFQRQYLDFIKDFSWEISKQMAVNIKWIK